MRKKVIIMNVFNPGGPLANVTPQQVNDGISINTRNQLDYLYPQKTGQTTSYAAGDDGALQLGRSLAPGSFFILDTANKFGNTNRFTNDKGGSATDGSGSSTANYIIDNLTGLGWGIIAQNSDTWSNTLTNASTFTVGTYSSFFMPNIAQLISIVNWSNTFGLNYAPFFIGSASGSSSSQSFIWSSTTDSRDTTTAECYYNRSGTLSQRVTKQVKTNNAIACGVFCRVHYS